MNALTPIVASFTSSGHAGTVIDTRVYDNGGRMTSSTYNNGVSESRAYNTDNTLASITFAGAAIGNLTYGWDNSSLQPLAYSLLLSTADLGNNGSIDVTYRFDALGRRVYRQSSSGTTVYVQSGQQTIADYVAGTAPASPIYRYVYASYIDEPVMRFKPVGSERTYYHRNQQYSIVALTGNTGAIQERYAYSAYGTPTITDSAGALRAASAVDNRITYTGREWDAGLVLYHYRARLYDPTLGRFCSRDPIGYMGGTHMFAYTGSGPTNRIDPIGLAYQACYVQDVYKRLVSHLYDENNPDTVITIPRLFCEINCYCPNGYMVNRDTDAPFNNKWYYDDMRAECWRIAEEIRKQGDCGCKKRTRLYTPPKKRSPPPEINRPLEEPGIQSCWSPLDYAACAAAGGIRVVGGVTRCIFNTCFDSAPAPLPPAPPVPVPAPKVPIPAPPAPFPPVNVPGPTNWPIGV